MSADSFAWTGDPPDPHVHGHDPVPVPLDRSWWRVLVCVATATHLCAIALWLVPAGQSRGWWPTFALGCSLAAGVALFAPRVRANRKATILAGAAATLAGSLADVAGATTAWYPPLLLWWMGVLAGDAGLAQSRHAPDGGGHCVGPDVVRPEPSWRRPTPPVALMVTIACGVALVSRRAESIVLTAACASCAVGTYLAAFRVGVTNREADRVHRQWQSTHDQALDREERIRRRRSWDALLHDKVLGALRLGSQDDPTSRAGARSLAAEALAAFGRLKPRSASLVSGIAHPHDPATLIECAATAAGIKANVDLIVSDAPPLVRDAVLAAVIEAVRNAAIHSGAAEVGVFGELGHQVYVVVRDAGVGFDATRVDPARLGVRRSIIGRLVSVGGDADVDSAPGAGTTVRLRWAPSPIDPAPVRPGGGRHGLGGAWAAAGLTIAALAGALALQRWPSPVAAGPALAGDWALGVALGALAVESVSILLLMRAVYEHIATLTRLSPLATVAGTPDTHGARRADRAWDAVQRTWALQSEVVPILLLLARDGPIDQSVRDRCRAMELAARDSLAAAALVDPDLRSQLHQARTLGASVTLATDGFNGDPVELVATKIALRAALTLVTPTSRVTARWTPTRRPDFATVVVTDPAPGRHRSASAESAGHVNGRRCAGRRG
jgi:hypothetical protein